MTRSQVHVWEKKMYEGIQCFRDNSELWVFPEITVCGLHISWARQKTNSVLYLQLKLHDRILFPQTHACSYSSNCLFLVYIFQYLTLHFGWQVFYWTVECFHRFWAHIVMAYVFTFWTFYVLYHEYKVITTMRLRFLANQNRRPDQFTVRNILHASLTVRLWKFISCIC